MFQPSDIAQLAALGIPEGAARAQIAQLTEGFPFMDIREPATVGRGIMTLEKEELADLIEVYRNYDGRRIKFVPASGAASRMFKHLHEFLELNEAKAQEALREEGFHTVGHLARHLERLALYPDLAGELHRCGHRVEELVARADYRTILRTLLEPSGLNYSSLPKGLIPFHRYGDTSRTAAEEHLVEGAQYARNPLNEVHVHFTVSPEHREGFARLMAQVLEGYTQAHGVKFRIGYSEQKRSTDTLAVDLENRPFRERDGRLMLRPGGHGALIENLNELEADLIFVKNIDNLVPDRLKPQTVLYKKALAGLLISYQSIVFDYLNQLEGDEELPPELLDEVLTFTIDELCITPPASLNRANPQAVRPYLIGKLNRPIRVCGMVRNQGEPGGGPFWAANPDGSVSLQVVESSQIDLADPAKRALFEAATHFNPVDLVCGVTDAEGAKFDLLRHRDPNTGFISTKSKDGRALRALELPGLWNGAMSDWITLFVEVPLITFNPVKTLNDLLREEHMG